MKVTEGAVRARINRKLADDGQRLIKARSWQMRLQYGPFYIVDGRNIMQEWAVDLEEKARELGALRTNEVLAQT